MANKPETTFGTLEMDQRYKKLERCLKLALLKEKHKKNVHNIVEQSISTWPSISSINADTINSSCINSSLQVPRIDSEVLASSNNLKSMFPKNKTYNMNKDVITTSSVKQYNDKQDNHIDRRIMPPPPVNRVCHTSKKKQDRVYVSSEYEKPVSTLLNSSTKSSAINNFTFENLNINTPSSISANTNNDKKYWHSLVKEPPKDLPKFERIFSRWKVMLNDQHQLIIKGTLENGKIARSKPVIRRYSSTCVESIFKHQYRLQGNITDERNELPDYIHGKFYNGFPDDWENVYQIWRTFVSQGCLITFRWPTPITDSDDDLKSEITDLTYACKMGNKSNPLRSYEAIGPAKQVIQPKSQANNSLEKIEKCHNCTCSTQSYGKNHFTFVKSSVSDAEQNKSSAAQETNASNRENKQNTKTNVNLCNPKNINKLKDFLQEDKLDIIINNLADRNCSPKYIEKIIEMFSCLNYVMSYKTETEYTFNTIIESCNTSKSEAIPLQKQKLVCNKDNYMNNNLKKRTELKSQMHSCDLGYGSIKNDTDPSQLRSNVKDNVIQECSKHEDSDQSESETYAGVPKISIERILQAREASRKLPKRKVRKKTTQADQQMYAANEQHKENIKHEFTVHTATPMANVQKENPFPDESNVSITEEEVEAPKNTKTCHGVVNIVRKPQETMFGSHQLQRTGSDVHVENTAACAMRMQHDMYKPSFVNKLDFIQSQRIKPNVLTKEQNLHEIQEKSQLQFTDVDYATNSDVEKDVAIASNVQKMGESAETGSHADLYRDIMINSENNNHFSEELRVSRESRKESVKLPKDKAATTGSKPVIISSVPVNFSLKLTKVDVHRSANSHDSDVSIVDNENMQHANVCPIEEACKKNPAPAPKTAAAKPALVVNKSLSKMTVDIKKENHVTSNIASNVKNESDNTNFIGATKSKMKTRRSSKQVHEDNTKVLTAWVPRVVHHSTSETELGLTFQGKLLNECGHIVHRNFITKIVLRRLSPTLIETVNHEFYQLLGPLNDNKHVIPKELVKQCRHGCPAKIEQFCLTWKSLQHGKVEEVEEKLNDTTMDSLIVPISSRGRKILPPLCYWTGERVTLKDNTPIYSLGNSKESSLSSLVESPKKNIKTNKRQRMDLKNTSVLKQKPLSVTNKVSNTNKNQTVVIDKVTPIKSPEAKAADNIKEFRKSTANGKRRTAQLTFSSTDFDDEECRVSPRKRLRNSQSNTNGSVKVHTRYTMTLRKRQKMEVPWNEASCEDASKYKNDAAYCSPTRKSYGHNMTYAYYQGIPREDLLSEDQVSPI